VAISHPARTLTLAFWDGPFGPSADGDALVWTLEPDDVGVANTLVERRVSQTVAVGQSFRDTNPVGTYLYQTIQELGSNRPSYPDTFAAAKAAPLPLDAINALGVPVLFGRGEFDHVVDASAPDALVARVPRSTRVTIAGSGHSPYFEQPDAWNAAVRTHLARAGG
jgi:3-oxoadipate enol-lactonase